VHVLITNAAEAGEKVVRKREEEFSTYLHSQIFSEKFPSESISASKTPTTLLRNDSLPVDDVL
jgi:hypothetical protein